MKQVLPPGEFVQMFEKNKKGKKSAHTCSSSYFSITGGQKLNFSNICTKVESLNHRPS